MEGEVLVRPPCFESERFGNQNRIHGFQRLFLLKVLCFLAVTFRRFVINSLTTTCSGVPGCFIQLLTVIVIKEPGGQPGFSSQLFTFPQLPLVLAAGRRCSCFILGGAAEGLNVTDYRLHLFGRLHFFFFFPFPCVPPFSSFTPPSSPAMWLAMTQGLCHRSRAVGADRGRSNRSFFSGLCLVRGILGRKTPFSEALAAVWAVAEKTPRAVLTTLLFIG